MPVFLSYVGMKQGKIDGNFGSDLIEQIVHGLGWQFIMTPVVFAMGKCDKITKSCDQTSATLLKLKGAKKGAGQ